MDEKAFVVCCYGFLTQSTWYLRVYAPESVWTRERLMATKMNEMGAITAVATLKEKGIDAYAIDWNNT
jgi:hypothetical protein